MSDPALPYCLGPYPLNGNGLASNLVSWTEAWARTLTWISQGKGPRQLQDATAQPAPEAGAAVAGSGAGKVGEAEGVKARPVEEAPAAPPGGTWTDALTGRTGAHAQERSAELERLLGEWRQALSGNGYVDGATRSELYLLLEPGRRGLEISGFWVRIGEDYATEDWDEFDGEPPVVRSLTRALTEAVWWRGLRPFVPGRRWSPILILEWPPSLAVMAGYEDGLLMTVVLLSLQAGRLRHRARFRLLPPQELAAAATARGGRVAADDLGPVETNSLPSRRWWPAILELDVLRQGDFAPPMSPLRLESLLPEDELGGGRTEEPPQPNEAHHRRRALYKRLIGGWLNRDAMQVGGSVAMGQGSRSISENALGSERWLRALRGALALLVILGVSLPLSIATLEAVTVPPNIELPRVNRPANIETLSFCTPDNPRFVRRLSCWLHALAVPGPAPLPSYCGGDAASSEPAEPDLGPSLNPTWCGLLARVEEQVSRGVSQPVDWNAGEQAIVNACFEVLGEPATYRLVEDGLPVSGRSLGARGEDPAMELLASDWASQHAFLTARETRIESLIALISDIRKQCGAELSRLEHHMATQVTAAHVSPELQVRLAQRDPQVKRAFSSPASAGWTSSQATSARDLEPARRLWLALDGLSQGKGGRSTRDGSEAWGDAYLLARFEEREEEALTQSRHLERHLPTPLRPSEGLMSCYLQLPRDGKQLWSFSLPEGSVATDWGLRLPRPLLVEQRGYARGYRSDASIVATSQLQLDAVLSWLGAPGFEGAGAVSIPTPTELACWRVVQGRLERYSSAHPLLGPPARDWPTEDQQVCGQICQAYYGLDLGSDRIGVRERNDWATPEADVRACLDPSAFLVGAQAQTFAPVLELWDPVRRRYVQPPRSGTGGGAVEQACAFHLLAQGRLEYSGGETSPLLDIPPRAWSGSGTAGERTNSRRSALIESIEGALGRMGDGEGPRPTSDQACQAIAAQCLTTGLLTTLKKTRRDAGRGAVTSGQLNALFLEELAQAARQDPFCQPLQRELLSLSEQRFVTEVEVTEDICFKPIQDVYREIGEVMDLYVKAQ